MLGSEREVGRQPTLRTTLQALEVKMFLIKMLSVWLVLPLPEPLFAISLLMMLWPFEIALILVALFSSDSATKRWSHHLA